MDRKHALRELTWALLLVVLTWVLLLVVISVRPTLRQGGAIPDGAMPGGGMGAGMPGGGMPGGGMPGGGMPGWSGGPPPPGMPAARAPARDEKATGLYSDDMATVAAYLKANRIPNVQDQYVLTVLPGPIETSPEGRQVRRAADLFVKADSEMRLTIVRAMDQFNSVAPRMWDACGEDDYEARHYLLYGVATSGDEKRTKEAKQWLLESADPRLAAPILRAVCKSSLLLHGLTPEDEKRTLQLLRGLYRQTGDMVYTAPAPVAKVFPGESGPVRKYVVRALGHVRSPAAAEQLFEWMIADGMKSPPSVRCEMWSAFGRMNDALLVVPREKIRELAGRREIVELWLITPPAGPVDVDVRFMFWYGKDILRGTANPEAETARLFKRTAVQQLTNPDPEVVEGLARYLVREYDDKEIPTLVEQTRMTMTAKERARESLTKALADFSVDGLPDADRRKRFEDRKAKLLELFQ